MRIHLKIKTANTLIPFNHQHLLTGTIHKWLGWNNEHGNLSLYSFSQLSGCSVTDNGFTFKSATSMFFSSHDSILIKTMISGIQKDADMFNGLTVTDIIMQDDPDMTSRNLFYVASPIFIKRRVGERDDHIIYNDSRANGCLKETLISKMEKIGLNDESLVIMFDDKYPKAGTKMIAYKEVENRCSWCPVIIEGKPETKLFAWNVGLGNSTGIGFGSIK
ncbi:MAG: CRISPR-associated endoribonuclease Cas6 [Bacteroidetes bacterium HGW-Bacteroidetes-8]|jgi:CRISPR-associated endoribonuclease Cas6|nr:MAG: CRISPR-associated endoribonuclease Cas6 [Bacteroidetes bacterium HGW-Bacteroidetes-8]